ncbi:hypothetical protein ACIG3E_37185 [Streptomyces sp. NPDC053474]|uniref:hypothetical protein n=1 Tax=Streptomyces sp. NPDC053474 TaxID=3365704 RepID=UPI0037D45819
MRVLNSLTGVPNFAALFVYCLMTRRCEAAVGSRALVVTDLGDERRVLVIHPLRPGPGDDTVADELTRVVTALVPGTSLGGSKAYAIALTADALREAVLAQCLAVHQPGSIAISAHRADLVTLLEPLAAQRWAEPGLPPRDAVTAVLC